MNKLKVNLLGNFKFNLFALAMLFAIPDLKAQKPDFSGNYTRNTDKCDAGGLSVNSVPVEIWVKQGTNEIEIKRTSKNYAGENTVYTEQIKFDGTPSSSIIKPDLNKKSSIQWASDQKGFTENAVYIDNQGNPKQNVQETWAFEGSVLKVQLTLTLNGQEYDLTEIFDKK